MKIDFYPNKLNEFFHLEYLLQCADREYKRLSDQFVNMLGLKSRSYQKYFYMNDLSDHQNSTYYPSYLCKQYLTHFQ